MKTPPICLIMLVLIGSMTLSRAATTLTYSKADDLDFQGNYPGSFLYAVTASSAGNGLTVGDATFTLDTGTGGVTTIGANGSNFDPWQTPAISGSVNPTDDANLALITRGINFGDTLSISLTGLTIGEEYKLQLMFLERAGAFTRQFDVALNGSPIATAFEPPVLQNTAIIENFIAASNTATISFSKNPYQPILNALTLEHTPEPSRALLTLMGLSLVSLRRRRSRRPRC